MKTLLLTALAAVLFVPPAARAATGQRLEITTSSDVQAPDAAAIVRSLLGDEAGPKRREVQVRVIKKDDASTTLQIDVRGVTLPGDSADRLRAMFPSLKDAQIALVATSGRAGHLPEIGPGELDTPEKIAAFKERLQKKLAAEGKTGTVDVQVTTGADGKQQVRVEVKAEKEQ